jgi:hypothetical protein
MNINKIVVLLIVLLLSLSNKTFSQSEVFQDGEELIYDVYYSFINIGWVKFNTLKESGKKDTYICTGVVRSNEAMPFADVSFDFISEIEIRDNNIRPLHFTSKEYKNDRTSELNYYFNYDSSSVNIIKTGYDGKIEYEKRISFITPYQDGLSIFYYARYNSFKKKTENIPVLFNQDSTGIILNFNTAATDVSIDEVQYDISTVELKGTTDYNLVFGLTGDFSGWFTSDKDRVPVKARLKVKIGNVTLELKGWRKNNNWKPPEY